MKKITIKKITFLNFKGVRNAEIEFNADLTRISGANGTGKTTIADAFRWLLFGKDSEDRKDFNVKTLDETGKVIERIPHEVAAVIEINGEETTLKKCFTEKWTKRRGTAEEVFSGNTVECFYNDVPVPVTEYNIRIAAICSEGLFKLITSPTFFVSQKKEWQRNALMNLAGGISQEDILASSPEFAELASLLERKTPEELAAEIANKKKHIASAVENIPVRIDERRRSMPEAQDWSKLEDGISEAEAVIKNVEDQIADRSKMFNAATEERQHILKLLADVNRDIAAREYEVQKEQRKDYEEQRRAHETAVSKAKSIRSERRLKALALPRLKSELEQLQDKREQLLQEWKEIKSYVFLEPDRDDFICPTCKQPLPDKDIDEKIEELRQRANAHTAQKLERNKAEGTETRERITAKEKEISSLNDELFRMDAEAAEIENSEAHKATPQEPDCAPALAGDALLVARRARAEELHKQLTAEITPPDLTDLQMMRKEQQNVIDGIRMQLRDRRTIEEAAARIQELEGEYRAAQAELTRLEGLEYAIQQFRKARITIVEDRVNKMFSLVRFRMYEQLINGGEAETCEATVDGVPYSDLNNAMKICAGLDIINTFGRVQGVLAPVFIDNAEAINELPSIEAQTIALIVTNEEKLTVK